MFDEQKNQNYDSNKDVQKESNQHQDFELNQNGTQSQNSSHQKIPHPPGHTVQNQKEQNKKEKTKPSAMQVRGAEGDGIPNGKYEVEENVKLPLLEMRRLKDFLKDCYQGCSNRMQELCKVEWYQAQSVCE